MKIIPTKERYIRVFFVDYPEILGIHLLQFEQEFLVPSHHERSFVSQSISFEYEPEILVFLLFEKVDFNGCQILQTPPSTPDDSKKQYAYV